MADLTRAEELVRTMERDDAFQAEVASAPTVTAKRAVLESRGYADVSIDDMRTYVESKGGTLVVPATGRELSEQELAAVAGGTSEELEVVTIVVFAADGFLAGTAVVAAAGAA